MKPIDALYAQASMGRNGPGERAAPQDVIPVTTFVIKLR